MKHYFILILFAFGINIVFTSANSNKITLSNPTSSINFEITAGDYKEKGEFYQSEACLYGDSLKLKFVHKGKFQTLFFYVYQFKGDNTIFGVEHGWNCMFYRNIYEYRNGDLKINKIGKDSISVALNSILVHKNLNNIDTDTMIVYGSLILKSMDCDKK